MTEKARTWVRFGVVLVVSVGPAALIFGLSGAFSLRDPGSGPTGPTVQSSTASAERNRKRDTIVKTGDVSDDSPTALAGGSRPVEPPPRLTFTIDPNTPLRDLLPTPPKARLQKPSAFVDDLSQVPEVTLTEPFGKKPDSRKEMEAIAHQIAKINFLNVSKKDVFLEKLIASRADLQGLPFVLGGACRLTTAYGGFFARAVGDVHSSLQSDLVALRRDAEDDVLRARVAAVMQICSPASNSTRRHMAKYLASVSHTDATRALARIVLFSPESDVRDVALKALAVRKESDYAEVLLEGFRYPWPAVATRAAEALVTLKRVDLMPQLIGLLEAPDPRAPVIKEIDGKTVATVRELVRINHHRNCLMCHAPGQDAREMSDRVVSQVPVPGEKLPSFQDGYYEGKKMPELLVRFDVTYLRQDFSLMLPAGDDTDPWPDQQRFDFVTRTRELTADELEEYRKKFDHLADGVLPPNQRAAHSALRELTGKDAAPNAVAWRKVLNIN